MSALLQKTKKKHELYTDLTDKITELIQVAESIWS